MTVLSPDQLDRGAATIRVSSVSIEPESHVIFVPRQPTPTERVAAEELQFHLGLITGRDFAIRPESQRSGEHGFFIGRCEAYALSDAQWAELGEEGLIIRTHGADVQLAGDRRGVLYAVSVFLEDYLGCRWFAADCMRVPTSGTITLPVIDVRHIPVLESRALDYPEHRDPAFAMRNRMTSANARLDAAHGGRVEYHPFVHSFDALVPRAEYFEQHPEYYALIDGERTATSAQLCLTNPDVLTVAKAKVRTWIAERPDAQFISVSQNDNGRYCQCENCSALAEHEGSQAGPLLHFVNAIAADIGHDHPDKIIDTLAYRYTRKPPEHVRPAANVTVRLCSIECCFSHPIDGCPENASFMEDLRGWSEICRRLSIWDYVISYRHTLAPWPNLYVLQPNIRTFVDHGVTSIYEEANYFSRGGEMAALRAYIMAKTLWDPDYDTDHAIDEFLPAYYGAAATHVRRYIDLLHERFADGRGAHITIWQSDPHDYLDVQFVAEAHALFARARAAVRDDPTRLRRVRLVHLGVIYMTLFETPVYERRGDRLIWRAAPPAGIDAWQEFWEVVTIERITHHQEGRPMDTINHVHIPGGAKNPITLTRIPMPAEVAIHRLSNREVQVELLPSFGGRIHALTSRRTGRDWFKGNHPDGYTLLAQSGSELYSQRSWRSPGWAAPFTVTQRSDRHIVMHTVLDDGLELERRITLAGGARVLCRDTLRNTSDEPREATLRIHPVFDMVRPASTRIMLRSAAGRDHAVDLPRPTDTEASTADLTLQGEQAPADWWGIADEASGERVVHRVIAGEVGRYFVSVDDALRQLSLELWSPTRTLNRGEQIAIEHEYELF